MAKRYSKKDPHQQREKKKYGTAAPSREYITQYISELNKPVNYKDLCLAFGLRDEAQLEGLRFRLKAMLRDGQLHQDRRGKYGLSNKLKLLSGRVIGHRDGYGFVVTDTAGPDVFLPERDMRSLLSDDRVLIRVVKVKSGKRLEGQLVEVLERNTTQLVGVYHQDGAVAFVKPDSKHIALDIIIPNEGRSDAQQGQFVEVEIVTQPSKRNPPVGKVVRVIGDELTPGLEIDLAIANYKIPHAWPNDVIEEAALLQEESAHVETNSRKDLRDCYFVTIDGEDSKDFDDAVYCQPRDKGGWVLFVAIADVSHYVEVGSACDREAEQRGNSVYFPGRVIPMLPEILSNELCSLRPNVDRLTMVCEMQVSAEGELQSSQVYSAIIHSKQRLTYKLVAKMIEQPSDKEWSQPIHYLHQLFQALSYQRSNRGALDFETTETRIIFNEHNKIDAIVPVFRNVAHKIIEECMLLANVAVSQFCENRKINALYRVHEPPDPLKLKQLKDFIKLFGLRLTGGDVPATQDFSQLLTRVAEREDAALLQRVILRTQKQAVYFPENSGHFGLGYEGYTHFTSPIRRYSDLIVHRALKHLVASKKPKDFIYDKESIATIADHCTMTEKRADYATREAMDRLKCDFMQDKVGGVFMGTIVEVTSFGVFVELDEYYVQGLLHISALAGDYYHFDELHHALIGKHSGKSYKLTDQLQVLVARVSVEDRKIDFDLAESV